MTTITNDILEMLEDDMVSHGLITQCMNQSGSPSTPTEEQVKEALNELLTTGKVEIGLAKMTTPDYVEFVAWQGTIDEKVRRGIEAVNGADGPDKEFVYWLCLRENVDRFEGHDE